MADETVDSRDAVNVQSWIVLLNSTDFSESNSKRALQWIVNNAITRSNVNGHPILGAKFSTSGSGPVTEASASAALAFWFQPAYKNYYDQLSSSIVTLQRYAPLGDGLGVVASLNSEAAGDATGFFPYLQTAATVWSALALQIPNNEYANPFADYSKKKLGPVKQRSLRSVQAAAQDSQTTQTSGDNTQSLAIAALAISCAATVLCVIFVIGIIAVNIAICSRFFRRYVEEEEKREVEMNKYKFQDNMGSPVNSPVVFSPDTPISTKSNKGGLHINTSPVVFARPGYIGVPNRLLSPPSVDRLESPNADSPYVGSPVVMIPGASYTP
jgi:hypothetical protein